MPRNSPIRRSQKISPGSLTGYAPLLAELKERVRTTQLRAAQAANAELLGLYWHVGYSIVQAQKKEGWGRAIVPRLAQDLAAEFPEIEGFSERNIGRMLAFHREYPELFANLPQAAAKSAAVGARKSSGSILPQAAAKSDSPEVHPSVSL